jgi:hypothetical protein
VSVANSWNEVMGAHSLSKYQRTAAMADASTHHSVLAWKAASTSFFSGASTVRSTYSMRRQAPARPKTAEEWQKATPNPTALPSPAARKAP